jgi:hypothetical protein
MVSVSSTFYSHNHKLYFSKSELSKILSCYSLGVTNGNWKDYALNFRKNEAIFSFYKHTLATPDCVLKKYKEKKLKKTLFYLFISNKKNTKFDNIDKLISSIKRSQIFVI